MSGIQDQTPAPFRPRQYRIEFVGGPFDGHVELFPDPAEQLPQDLMWCVCETVFHNLDGKCKGPRRPVTSIAVYERKIRRGVWWYFFVGALSPRELGERCAEGDFCFADIWE